MDSPIPVRPLSTQMASAVKKAAARVRVRNTATTTEVVMSLPKGMVKNSVVGGLLALAVYVAMQFFYALLIHRGAVGIFHLLTEALPRGSAAKHLSPAASGGSAFTPCSSTGGRWGWSGSTP